METAPRNCRFLSLVVVELVLTSMNLVFSAENLAKKKPRAWHTQKMWGTIGRSRGALVAAQSCPLEALALEGSMATIVSPIAV